MEHLAGCWGDGDDAGCSQGPLTWDLLVPDKAELHCPLDEKTDSGGMGRSLPDPLAVIDPETNRTLLL